MKKHNEEKIKKENQEAVVEETQDQTTDTANETQPEEYVLTAEQMNELKSSIENLQKERDEYLTTAQRLQAEFDNFRKRNGTLRIDSIREGTINAVSQMLPVLDNLERALSSAQSSGEKGALLEGVEMIFRQFNDVLTQLDVKEIEALGVPFDPQKHHAVAQEEANEEQEAGTVLEVFQKGYSLADTVIRPSMVKVAQN